MTPDQEHQDVIKAAVDRHFQRLPPESKARYIRWKKLEILNGSLDRKKYKITANLWNSVTLEFIERDEALLVEDDEPEKFPSEGLLLRLHILLK